MATITMGKKVKIRFVDGEEEVTIVPPHEYDIASGKISATSPIGQAILNCYSGEIVTFKNSSGQLVSCEIININ